MCHFEKINDHKKTLWTRGGGLHAFAHDAS